MSDPRWSIDEKKRRRLLRNVAPPGGGGRTDTVPAYQLGGILGPRGVVDSLIRRGAKADSEFAANVAAPFEQGGAIGTALFGPKQLPVAEAMPAIDPADHDLMGAYHENEVRRTQLNRDAANGVAKRLADQYRADPASGGLTRIVKNPDGSYTNMPDYEQAGGQERYYNQYGNREFGGGDPNGPAKNFATDDVAMLRAVGGENHQGGGIRSIAFAEQGTLLREQRQEEAALAAMEPEDRRALMVEQMRQGGANTRASLTRDVALRGQDLTAQTARDTAEIAAKKFALDSATTLTEQDSKMVALAGENPALFMQQALAKMENLPPKEKLRRLIDPDNVETAIVRNLVRKQISDNPNFDLSAVKKAGAYRKWAPWGDKADYVASNGIFGGDKVDFAKIGLRDDKDIQLFIDSVLNEDARNKNR